MKTAILPGTRAEITRMSPLMRECEVREAGHYMQNDGLGNSDEMGRVWFNELELTLENTIKKKDYLSEDGKTY